MNKLIIYLDVLCKFSGMTLHALNKIIFSVFKFKYTGNCGRTRLISSVFVETALFMTTVIRGNM